MTVKSYDPETLKLAQYFLAGDVCWERVTTAHALALSIQQAVEDHLEAAQEQRDREDGPPDTGDAWSGGFADNH